MTEAEATAYVVGILRVHRTLTTRQFERLAHKRGRRCPDGTVKFLMQLRLKSVIQGGVSTEARGWVWWLGGTTATIPPTDETVMATPTAAFEDSSAG